METPGDQFTAASFMGLWAESLATVLGQIASAPYAMSVVDQSGNEPETQEQDTYLNLNASGAVRGESVLRLPGSAGRTLADLFTGATSAGAEITADDRAALEELFRQVAGYVCTSAKNKVGALQLTVAVGTAPTWPAAANGWIASAEGAPNAIKFEWRLSAALKNALTALEAANGNAKPETAVPAAPDNSALDMFMNLALDVSIRFGGRNVLLKEVLELGPGAVLELDREVNDVADLLLEGKLIARGEVVLVDGYFGLRVTQVVGSPQFD